jgi:hypothetical protein
VDPSSLHRAGPVLRVTVSRQAGTSDFEALLKAVRIEVHAGARDIISTAPEWSDRQAAPTAFVRLLLGHRRDLGISVSLEPGKDSSS